MFPIMRARLRSTSSVRAQQLFAILPLQELSANDPNNPDALTPAAGDTGKELLMMTLQEHSSHDRISDLAKRLLDELSAPASRSPFKRYQ